MASTAENILEPIDPLDISFSQDKCVKTPETQKESNASSPHYARSLAKDPISLFEQKQNSTPNRRSMTPKHYKYETTYKPAYILPEIELRGWSQSKHSLRRVMPIVKPLAAGMIKEGAHLK